MSTLFKLAGGAVAALTFGLPMSAVQAQTVKIDGSSTVFPVTEAVAEEYQKANKGQKVTASVTGNTVLEPSILTVWAWAADIGKPKVKAATAPPASLKRVLMGSPVQG
jgi:hypothetical protein